ncbi:hypothetical protein CROQUDRAFT_92491 [Cronartium quercuum f. sp. fusiforme G11]|uniref:Uncharacterized protein n=1 Tax=Cronartium quercuum f. sp. fusiforme G11 TaxID=708437 RepID=A0A9P6NGR4_9BASI|nr:hypothetical protein CROQUDRAFT_92491 [Cronartium quercuum f. sp. fusiforme G11]
MFFNDIQILENFKQATFPISDELDVDENENGNSAILQVEDMAGNLNMQVQILGCQIYRKTKEVLVKSQQDWSEFLVKALVAKDGAVSVVYTVVNPAQKHAEEEATLSCKQAALWAHNILAGKTTTASAIADTVPQDPKQPWLAHVLNRHGTKGTNKEGWQVYNPNNFSQYIQLTHLQMCDWAKELSPDVP